MKKLKKVSINQDKIMNNKELMNFKGGYDEIDGDNCYFNGEFLGFSKTADVCD